MALELEECKNAANGTHWIESRLVLPEGEHPNSDYPFFKESIDVTKITAFNLSADCHEITIRDGSEIYTIPISIISKVTNFEEQEVTTVTSLLVYDFFAKAKGFIK